MNRESVERAAWLAFEEGRLEEADRLWTDLIEASAEEAERDRLLGQHAYVLVAQGRYGAARSVYEDLFAKTRSHKHLHQIGMVEREAGNLDKALEIFEEEARILPRSQFLEIAANLYEQSLLQHLLGERLDAKSLMRRCLAMARRTNDWTMLGVAYRLKGDLLSGSDARQARSAFLEARAFFSQAGDEFGMEEIERRLESLQKDPPR